MSEIITPEQHAQRQHHDSGEVLNELTRVREAIGELKISFESSLKLISLIPVSVSIVASVSYLFYMKSISEWTWGAFMLIVMFPYGFGDGIKTIMDRANPWKK